MMERFANITGYDEDNCTLCLVLLTTATRLEAQRFKANWAGCIRLKRLRSTIHWACNLFLVKTISNSVEQLIVKTAYISLSDTAIRVDSTIPEIFNISSKDFGLSQTLNTQSLKGYLTIRCDKPQLRPPPGSVRIRYWPEGQEIVYRTQNCFYVQVGDSYRSLIDLNSLVGTIEVQNELSPTLGRISSTVKWLLIKALEKAGFIYIHAAVALMDEGVILLNADPTQGKTSCLIRLLNHGAQLISDDSFLYGNGKIWPCDFTPSLRGDFKSRFGSKETILQTYKSQQVKGPIKNRTTKIVFPGIWESSLSLITPLSATSMLHRLYLSYKKEASWNSFPELKQDLLPKYKHIFSRAKAYEFLAGNSEPEVCTSLIQLCSSYRNKRSRVS
ncbi:MAG: hypothetical protein FJ112_01220 [Deltaproteobacteria bacterium]|nr:hypothetical protein [Deltaproteobacteria bacterium]